jgi:hypothetical protein
MSVSLPGNKVIANKLEISWIEKGIIRIHFKDGSHILPSDQEEMIELQRKFTNDETHATIFTSGKSVTFSLEARENAVKLESATKAVANAAVVNNIFFMAMSGIYSSIFKMKKPYKSFSSEAAAVKWIRTFL